MKNYSNETLLKRLSKLDEKYYNQSINSKTVDFGYGMRAYHRLKTMNLPEWKTKDKANEIMLELRNRNVQFNTIYL